jgi:hypothetical protein
MNRTGTRPSKPAMKTPIPFLPSAFLISLPLALALACGGESGGGDSSGADGGANSSQSATGEGPCESADECEGNVCVALIDGNHPPNYCSQECGSCPGGFYCDSDTFGLVGLSFCRFGNEPSEPSTPPEPPRLPCKSDAECGAGLVCAEFMGESDCTTPCAVEEDCTYSFQGLTIDLAECAPDQRAGQDRQVCLPDLSCYPDATSCISFGGF